MDMMTLTAGNTPSVIDVAPQNPEKLLSGRCAAMAVTYLPGMGGLGQELMRDDITILVPGDQAAFHASYRAADGLLKRALVRAPLVSIIPAQQPHALYCQRQADVLVITLDRGFFERKAREALGSEALEIVERYAAFDPFMREIGNTLRNELRSRNVPSAAYLESLAGVIAIHLAKNYGSRANATCPYVGLSPRKLHQVQAFIREHLADPIRVEQLAAAVQLSPYHFARMFKKATGQPPHAYITMQRMERAKELLSDSDLPLVEVAGSVGFQTQAHFTGVFRRYTGLTPRVYRLNCQAARFRTE